ncbi:Hypothetical_protein [Hexamita inflata]|uniref:Hypothetical_protein n=1 Tax=Hexamita inflata TaxID=28002 RepID=A0AA86V1D2_9EUKA|nr:Hypothetical protein HINF_LOCUS42273 [Hexamita inflata]
MYKYAFKIRNSQYHKSQLTCQSIICIASAICFISVTILYVSQGSNREYRCMQYLSQCDNTCQSALSSHYNPSLAVLSTNFLQSIPQEFKLQKLDSHTYSLCKDLKLSQMTTQQVQLSSVADMNLTYVLAPSQDQVVKYEFSEPSTVMFNDKSVSTSYNADSKFYEVEFHSTGSTNVTIRKMSSLKQITQPDYDTSQCADYDDAKLKNYPFLVAKQNNNTGFELFTFSFIAIDVVYNGVNITCIVLLVVSFIGLLETFSYIIYAFYKFEKKQANKSELIAFVNQKRLDLIV